MFEPLASCRPATPQVAFWHIAPVRGNAALRRFRPEADMNRLAKPAASVVNDPKPTWAGGSMVCV
jgi:hypothetical protein